MAVPDRPKSDACLSSSTRQLLEIGGSSRPRDQARFTQTIDAEPARLRRGWLVGIRTYDLEVSARPQAEERIPRSATRVLAAGCGVGAKQTRDVRHAGRKIWRGVDKMINATTIAIFDDVVDGHASFLTTQVVMHR